MLVSSAHASPFCVALPSYQRAEAELLESLNDTLFDARITGDDESVCDLEQQIAKVYRLAAARQRWFTQPT